MRRFTTSLSVRALAVTAFTLVGACALAATPSRDVQTRYEHERARCLSGQSGQVQDACLKEAVNARDAALKGQLADGNGRLRQNATQRCDVLAGDDKRDCLARITGAANTSESGSVKGGGILRESVTITVEPTPAAPPPPSPMQ
ncbi:MAG TPA: hypothetical protein VFA35_02605 [Burkholderiaceae bacterium]|nr:hypothetical protein [Burkholderiaceae bacterium]